MMTLSPSPERELVARRQATEHARLGGR
uniref:Uncharacterized protein n=1 Tax=Arundo donax TaxID=35708 RepID=A0A0A9B868_ARUDO